MAVASAKPMALAPDSPLYAINLRAIEDAASRIAGAVHVTPVLTCSSITEMAGKAEVFFKVEALQKSGSFKARGACNAVFSLGADEAKAGVVTHSSGNHAQAVAVAAQLRGVPAHIVMPSDAPSVKKQAVLGYGATVTQCEPTGEAREAAAKEVQAATGATFIHPSNDPRVMAGQGTMALELIQQIPSERCRLASQAATLAATLEALGAPAKGTIPPRGAGDPIVDAVIVPVGGGGMLSGVAVALASLDPRIRIFAAEPAGAADAAASVAAGELLGHETPPKTIADGLRTTLGSNTWPIVRDFVEAVIVVSEEAIADATQLVWSRCKIAIEPSAGVGVAALLSEEFRALQGIDSVAVVLCGGNADVPNLAS